MSEFDPTKPALVHDQLNDEDFEWKPEWAAQYDPKLEHSPGVIAWDGLMLDGWWAPPGDVPAQLIDR